MIGFYNYTVILTYVGLLSGVCGIASACTGHPVLAVFFLLFSGICDMFDGKIARTKKNRTEDEKRFGIQIDSLCDIVCFCVLPAVIGIVISNGKIWMIAICALLVLCGLIRLAYFNVVEEKRQSNDDSKLVYFKGMPVTSTALIIPFVFCFEPLFRNNANAKETSFYGLSNLYFSIVLAVFIGLMALLYILPLKIKKPYKIGTIIICLLGIAVVAMLICIYGFKLL